MPSSLTRVFPRTLEFSSCLPVSVYGTGGFRLTRSFSRQCGIHAPSLLSLITPHHVSAFRETDLPVQPTCLDVLFQSRAPVLPVSLHRSNGPSRYRNFNLLSIAYASVPRLRSRLTLRRRSLLRNPWAFGGKDSHLSFRYSYRHSLFLCLSTCPYGNASSP